MSAKDEQPVTAVAEATEASESEMDTERSKKILKAKELYSRGSRNYLVKSYAESADELSMVCELYQDLYGELSDELGMPYLLYAKSLIALALDENKIIDVPDEEDDDDDDDEEEEEEDNEEAASVDVAMAVDKVAAAANCKATNGQAAKLKSITEAEAMQSETAAEDGVDSTAEAAIEIKSTADENTATGKSAEKITDEAMVTSTEDAAKPKNGDSSNGAASSLTDTEKPSTSNGADAAANDEEDDENETASTLQLAWEILELAAKIFARQGLNGLPNLAEVQTELANIEFENNILESARDDYEKALKIYNELPSNYRRAMAEIHYKIGLTYLMQQLNKEGATSLKEACKLIEDEINEMQSKKDPTEKEKNTIQDMEETKEEILVKIGEIEEAQAQHLAEVRAALDKVIIKPSVGIDNADGAGPSSSADAKTVAALSSSSSSSAAAATATITSSTKPTDISHLIKRKKPEDASSEAEAATASPAKRPAV